MIDLELEFKHRSKNILYGHLYIIDSLETRRIDDGHSRFGGNIQIFIFKSFFITYVYNKIDIRFIA